MKSFVIFLYFLSITVFAFPQNNTKSIVLEIQNVKVNGGTLHISVCASEAAYKNRHPDLLFEFSPINTTMRQEIDVPTGECVILIYQDINNNGISDTGFFGIPKEPVGISNWNGGSPPGSFKKHKISITAATTLVTIGLYEM
jgi:uncharacterized protein (DUF2141 family)